MSAVVPDAMKILSWNYQGIGPPWTVWTLTELIKLHRSGLIFLSETKCKDINAWLHSDSSPDRWRFTGFYEYSEVANRREGWNLLRRLSQSFVRPWVCVGDFIEILAQHEKQGSLPRAQWQIRDFCECLSDCGLYDMGYEGDIFTWCNRREEPHMVRARLDRACYDTNWVDLFPRVNVFHEPLACLDHSAIWLTLDGESRRGLNRTK
ncbi:UNVERIFIED_CONTAM: hypothetical protein Slati_1441900 [Sesamum latifolium]|uniref:Endonuclease/exonuclease/phosphatase domain-containing protein n=1 Tax=Sesamum latifolium TaxID=2727402 RepID=A0AAW2X470_9LAMI